MNILTIGFMSEGRTDERFLQPIIKRTFENLALECQSEIEIYEPAPITVKKAEFITEVIQAAEQAEQN